MTKVAISKERVMFLLLPFSLRDYSFYPAESSRAVVRYVYSQNYVCSQFWLTTDESPRNNEWLPDHRDMAWKISKVMWNSKPTKCNHLWNASYLVMLRCLIKKWIQFLECSWNHEYFWSLAKLTLQETPSIHDSMNIPKIEFIAYIYILL